MKHAEACWMAVTRETNALIFKEFPDRRTICSALNIK
jgi:hypothetical protein